MPGELPSNADVVIIGGGVIGCSIAYHLTQLGIRNVVILERKRLTSGTTWHAAGVVSLRRPSEGLTNLAKYTAKLFRGLEEETGHATGYKQNGSVTIALTEDRFEEMKRTASMVSSFGLSVTVISSSEIGERLPHFNTTGVVGGLYVPDEGQINPTDLTLALAAGSRLRGAQIFENTRVKRIITQGAKISGVETLEGIIKTNRVVIAAGMWSCEIGKSIGVHIPLHAVEHSYVVTEPINDLPSNMPIVIIPDECGSYYKEDAGKLLFGAFEAKGKPWGSAGIDEEHEFETLPWDMGQFEPALNCAISRVPLLQKAGVRTFFCGPESFTPDHRYCIGEAPEVVGIYVACGFNSAGIQNSGAAGWILSRWIRDGHPPIDVSNFDIKRFHPFQSNGQYLRERTSETLGLTQAMHWPFRQFETARGVRRSVLYDRLMAVGACMGESAGWENPNWYSNSSQSSHEYSYGRQNWFNQVRTECVAINQNVAFIDCSSFTKFLVEGHDACGILNQICANEIDVAIGKIVYTQWLNERGGIEADLTVTRVAENQFLVVSGAPTQIRDLAWLRRHITEDLRCSVTDITSGLAMFSIVGPQTRALLTALTGEDMNSSAFPFGYSKEVEIGCSRIRASRISYVGELGWELYVPAEFALHVYEKIVAAGKELNVKHAGYYAMAACRMEKGYRHWGADIGPSDTPLDGGLSFAVAWEKRGGFIGKTALLKQKNLPFQTKRLVSICLADDGENAPMMYHQEPIYRDGIYVGNVTSGMWGHRICKSLALALVSSNQGVTADYLDSGAWEVEIACKRYSAKVQLQAFFDPKGERIRA